MSEQALPGHDHQPEEICCPGCGRFVGALPQCPHCGAKIHARMSVRVFRYASLLLGIVGLFLLYLMATNKEIPTVEISSIQPTMNFAYVRIEGEVVSDTRVYRDGDRITGLAFTVDDGTGEIGVKAYRGEAVDLVEQNKLPRRGDHVSVAGSLSVAAERDVVLRLQVTEHLDIEKQLVEVCPLGRISANQAGQVVAVEGVIRSVREPKSGSSTPWSLQIEDDTGAMRVVFWDDVYAEFTDKTQLAVGTRARIRASVDAYKGRPQLRLGRGTDFEVLGEASVSDKAESADVCRPEDVLSAKLNTRVTIKAVVSGFYKPKAEKQPYALMLQCGEGTLRVVFWDTLAETLSELPAEGDEVELTGKVSEYKGKRQLSMNAGDVLRVLGRKVPEPKAEPWPDISPVSAVVSEHDGEFMAVRGVLGEPESLPGGVLYPLKDDSGSVLILFWDREIPGTQRNILQPGLQVSVRGRVKDYKGKMELIPRSMLDVVIAEEASE